MICVCNKYKYKAYISYSHCDERWATWLHRALESYRLPRKLIGTKTTTGKVPPRVRPVFRDRDDLSSASDLGGTVKQALEDSENMIVVCSPDAAKSFWVNEEIRQFASLGRPDRVFCVIVDGDPAGTTAATNCFPEALTEIGLSEPLAADIRKWADGKRLSRLKLISGMLGLPLDQLRRRDLQKRQRSWVWMSVAAIAVTTVLVVAITSRIAAQQRRVSGESLVAYKLSELRTMLNVAVDPENLQRLESWSEHDLKKLVASAGAGDDALINRAISLREQGNELYRNSALDDALDKFLQSWALLAENYRRERDNQSTFFELGQAEFYIGQTYLDQGEMDKAEEAFMSYAEITRRLIVLQPENAEWVLEMAYALTNLGSLQNARDTDQPERTLQFMQSALEYNQIALVLDPQNEYYQSELGQSHAFLADAQLGVCDLEGALQSRLRNVSLEKDILAMDVDSTGKRQRLAWAWSGLASVQQYMGSIDAAIESYEQVLEKIELVLQKNPANHNIAEYMLDRKHRLLLLKAIRGDSDYPFQEMDALDEQWQLLFEEEVNDDFDFHASYASYLINRAWLAQINGDQELAEGLLEDAMVRVSGILQNLPGNRVAGNLLMQAAFQYWEIKQVLVSETILPKIPYYWDNSGQTWACSDASMAARKAIMLGDNSRAVKLTAYLLERGYRDKVFMRLCETYSLCKNSN